MVDFRKCTDPHCIVRTAHGTRPHCHPVKPSDHLRAAKIAEPAYPKAAWERTPDARYRDDVTFRQLVDMMESHFHTTTITPTEMREAALLAAIHYERRRIRHLHGYTMSDETARRCWATVEELYAAIQKDEPMNRRG